MLKLSEIIGPVPLYRELYGELLLSDLTEKDLEKLPELSKQEMVKGFPTRWMTPELQRAVQDNDYEFMTTSGTSGERTQLIRPKNWWQGEEKRLYNYLRTVAPNYTQMESKAFLTTPACSNTLCYNFMKRESCMGCCT